MIYSIFTFYLFIFRYFWLNRSIFIVKWPTSWRGSTMTAGLMFHQQRTLQQLQLPSLQILMWGLISGILMIFIKKLDISWDIYNTIEYIINYLKYIFMLLNRVYKYFIWIRASSGYLHFILLITI